MTEKLNLSFRPVVSCAARGQEPRQIGTHLEIREGSQVECMVLPLTAGVPDVVDAVLSVTKRWNREFVRGNA